MSNFLKKKLKPGSRLAKSILKKKAHNRNRILVKFRSQESSWLLMNPERDIEFYMSDKEMDIRNKENIHHSRLKTHGRSKLNGRTYFKGPKGGVFVLNGRGNKKYV